MIKKLLILVSIIAAFGCTHRAGHIFPINDNWFVVSEKAPWGILIPLKGLDPVSHKISADERFVYTHFATGSLNLSLWMEPINPDYATLEAVLKNKQNDKTIKGSEYVKHYRVGEFEILEYYLRKWPEGMPYTQGIKAGDEVNQFNVTAIYLKDGYWTDIHVSHPVTDKITLERLQESFKTLLLHTKIVKQRI